MASHLWAVTGKENLKPGAVFNTTFPSASTDYQWNATADLELEVINAFPKNIYEKW